MFDLSSQAVGGAPATAGSVATGTNSVNDLLALQWQQGLQLAQIQAQSGMVSNLVTALNNIARNVRAA